MLTKQLLSQDGGRYFCHKRVPAGDRYVERELLDVPRIGRAGSHSIEHRTPNRQIMGERSEDDYIYIYPSDDVTPIEP